MEKDGWEDNEVGTKKLCGTHSQKPTWDSPKLPQKLTFWGNVLVECSRRWEVGPAFRKMPQDESAPSSETLMPQNIGLWKIKQIVYQRHKVRSVAILLWFYSAGKYFINLTDLHWWTTLCIVLVREIKKKQSRKRHLQGMLSDKECRYKIYKEQWSKIKAKCEKYVNQHLTAKDIYMINRWRRYSAHC